MATSRYVTVNGKPLGFLSPRDEEVFAAGKIAALADLRAKVEALGSLQMRRPDDVYSAYVLRADVLELLDGSSE